MPTLTFAGGTSGRRTLILGEADGLSREITFPPGEPVEVSAKDRDAVLKGSRGPEFLEGGAEAPAATEPDSTAPTGERAGGEEG